MSIAKKSDTFRRGFTLVELLVVIGIIALLVGILLPTLNRARAASKQIVCGNNLRSIGQGFTLYNSQNNQYLPAAYVYNTGPGAPDVGGGTATNPTLGYTHWSWFIYDGGGEGQAAGEGAGSTPVNAFICPSMENGGLPPSNPADADRIPGQVNDPDTRGGIVDNQVPRCAYTVNEAIIPRNKFRWGITRSGTQGSLKSRRISVASVKNSSNVILATEFNRDWRIVSELNNPDEPIVIKSHRPVHGYELTGFGRDIMDAEGPNRLAAARVPPVQTVDPVAQFNRLWWVGRNHGRGEQDTTNFLFVDGHVENKLLDATLPVTEGNPKGDKFQWGNPVRAVDRQGLILSNPQMPEDE